MAVALFALAACVLPAAPSEASPAIRPAAYAAPDGLSAEPSARGPGSIVLNWDSSGLGVHYRVQYSRSSSFDDASTRLVRSASAAISGLKRKTRYYFRVQAATASGDAASDYSAAVSATTKTPADPNAKPLRVATYNIRNATKEHRENGEKPWSVRRKLVAAEIKTQDLDVLGLQEAEYTKVSGFGRQYLDLLGLLGEKYAPVSTGYSAGTRIVYQPKRLKLVKSGQRHLSGGGSPPRFVVWAIFVQKSTGRTFFFADTHLEARKDAKGSGKYNKVRISQAKQVVATIKANRGKLPVVLVGDMNSHKWRKPNNGPYHVYRGDGLVDPLDNTDFSRAAGTITAEVRIDTAFDSWNDFKSGPDHHPGFASGINVDYIWVSAKVTTLTYETVVDIDDATLKFLGPVPSDHNMVRGTLLIPKS